MIKKRRYWPKYVKGDDIASHFENLNIGDVDSIHGHLNGVPFDIFCMKDVNFVTSLMSTYGSNQRVGNLKYRSTNEGRISFQYPVVISQHYLYRHAVDDHNARRHYPISFERVWGTKFWASRVFSFLLAVTETNVLMASKFFGRKEYQSTVSFRKDFAKALIYNKYFMEETVAEAGGTVETPQMVQTHIHDLVTIPKKRKFRDGILVESVSDYPRKKCTGCMKPVRSYCSCSPGVYRCSRCYGRHCQACGIMI
jgi:hypothetical protein